MGNRVVILLENGAAVTVWSRFGRCSKGAITAPDLYLRDDPGPTIEFAV